MPAKRPGIRAPALVLLALAALGAGCARAGPEPVAPGTPVLEDGRLRLTVFAAEPEIVTPIGIAIDAADRVFVLESHTHLQRSDYPGPQSDRVKVFVDANADGRPNRVHVFAEGIDDGMNLAFSPAGELYVVAARGVWALHDRDGDGVSDARTRVLHMAEPERVYDHAALLGITFSHDGWMYVSRGNTGGSAWRVEGTDGSSIGGYGDGGNIIRARPDGTEVHEFATGFWNPFDLTFDAAGRLLAADNDPDSRGPNRLVHVVEGGDYGYKSLYGESGMHPYQSWNGEIPGTLPFAAALGEAPSGLIAAAHGALPADYRDDVLVTIWEERRIVRVRLGARGTSVAGAATIVAEGDQDFRPVALAADSRGTIYITDWVVREYANHGRGRIWRLAPARGTDVAPPRPSTAAPDTDPGGDALRALSSAGPGEIDRLRGALRSDDPFLRHAAVTALARPALRQLAVAATADPDAAIRLGGLLALARGGHEDPAPLARRLLRDPDLKVRRMALIWAGTRGMQGLRRELDAAILTDPPSTELFEVYLATLEQLSPEFLDAYERKAEPYARLLKRVLRPRFVESFIMDDTKPAPLRAMAITHLPDPASTLPLLVRLSGRGNHQRLRIEAVRSLALLPAGESGAALLSIARNPDEPSGLRAEALLGLSRQPVDAAADALALLDAADPAVRLEAARYLRSVQIEPAVREAIAALVATAGEDDPAVVHARLAAGTFTARRPDSRRAWQSAVGSGGDAAAGRRVFFSTLSACSGCHVVDRRGGDLGPDLTNVGLSKSRRQILESILQPSAAVSPEYQGWYVKTGDGQLHTGRQIDVGSGGRAELYVLPGRFVTLQGVVEYGPMPGSLMPDGLETNLTIEDMRDLLAFLEGAGG